MLNVIYVPGLGDKRPYGQKFITACWRLFGLRAHYMALDWADSEPFKPKLARLLAKIDELSKSGPIALVGVSAGASAVLNAFAVRKSVTGVVLICGKVQNPQKINEIYFMNNPPFKDSVFAVADSLKKLGPTERRRIMSIHPFSDSTVPIRDTIIPGAVEKLIRTRGHIFTIFYTIIFRSSMIANFIKNPGT